MHVPAETQLPTDRTSIVVLDIIVDLALVSMVEIFGKDSAQLSQRFD